MPRATDSVNENTSNLRGGRGTRGADPDPTEGVALREDHAEQEARAAAPAAGTVAPSVASGPPPVYDASPGDSGEPAADDAKELPVILDANLHSVRRFVAGDVIAERFVVVDGLPGSGMGQVYKALDRQRDATDAPSSYVAIKFGQPPGDDSSAPAVSIRREFEILSSLAHPNIVKAFEVGSHDGAEFMVMEWLEGQSLLHLLEEQNCKRMALRRAREIIRDVASGLACAHEKGVVHGDVKPSNIFITRRGAVKLLDFGAVSGQSGDSDYQSWATRAYASVDVLEGRSAVPSDDVYSLGVTAYLVLSGERPFGTKDALEAKRRNFKVQPLPQDARDLWPAVESALSFDATKRPADAARFLAEFLRLPKARTVLSASAKNSYLQYTGIAALMVLLVSAWAFRVDDLSGIDTRATLRQAELALAEGRLVEPDGDSALHHFKAVLSAAPENVAAQKGIDEIAGDYLVRAANALAVDDFEAARANLSVARRVSPGHRSIPIVERLFDRYATDLVASASLIASRDPAEARSILEQVEQLTDSESERIAEIRARMDDAAIDLELRMLFAGIDERILAERLAVPRGDSAIDLLNRARQLRPDDDRLPLAANRIVSALLFQALFAVSEGNLDRAEQYIAAAKSLDVRHLATARTVYELAKARDREAARVYELAIGSRAEPDATTADARNEPSPGGE